MERNHSVAQTSSASKPLAGMTVVISGVFSVIHSEMKALVVAHGGIVRQQVSRTTSIMLVGDKVGERKARMAADYGIRLVSEAEFREMIAAGGTATASSCAPELPGTADYGESVTSPDADGITNPSPVAAAPRKAYSAPAVSSVEVLSEGMAALRCPASAPTVPAMEDTPTAEPLPETTERRNYVTPKTWITLKRKPHRTKLFSVSRTFSEMLSYKVTRFDALAIITAIVSLVLFAYSLTRGGLLDPSPLLAVGGSCAAWLFCSLLYHNPQPYTFAEWHREDLVLQAAERQLRRQRRIARIKSSKPLL